MRVAGAVIDRCRLQGRELLPHVVGVQHVDAGPSCEPRDFGWRLRPRPAHEIGRAGEMLEQVAAREAGCAGDQNDVVHASRFSLLGRVQVRRSYCAW